MFAPLAYDFHDGAVAEVKIGPRREATLTVALDLPGRLGDHVAHIRFGGITNFEEVEAFLSRLQPPASPCFYIDRIDYLDYDQAEASPINRLAFRLELDQYGALTIRCRNVTTWQEDPAHTLGKAR